MALDEDAKFDFLFKRPSAIKATQYEDAVLSISAAMSPADFNTAVCSGIHAALQNVYKAEVLLFGEEDLTYYESNQLKHLIKSGVLWRVVRQRRMEIVHDITDDDPFWEVLRLKQKGLGERVGIVVPVLNRSERKVIALMIAITDEPTVIQLEKLDWVQKNTLIAAKRILNYINVANEKKRVEGMLKVCGSLMDLDISFLSIKIHKHIKTLVNCKACELLVIDEATLELVSQVFDESPLDAEIRLPINESIYGCCFSSGEIMVIDDVSQDTRINPAVDFINDYEPSNMLCVPVHGRRSSLEEVSLIGVVVCYDKIDENFSAQDISNVQFVLKFCANMISNTLAYHRELTLKKQNEALLNIAKNLFTRLNERDILLHAIMEEARNLIKAERCSLFLVKEETQDLVAVVFDSEISEKSNERIRLRIPIGQGIAGYVAKTGKTVNIKDAYKHPKFYKEVDKTTGFTTRNILCIPIRDREGVVGVAQLVNKKGGRFFTKVDEELAKTFSVYCGISIYHSTLYNDVVTEQSRSSLATELMVYHMQVQTDDVLTLAQAAIPECQTYNENFRELIFSPRCIPVDTTPMTVVSMIQEMDFIRKWKIPRNKLARFVLMVKKGYRDNPYHNWWHAVSVSHMFYLLHHNCDQLPFLSDLETFALFISCLCHDIDHRGTNNAFEVSCKSALASLYSSEGSVMERHHLAQTLCIINSKGCNLFENLTPMEYRQVLDLMHDDILATDLANHLRILKQLEKLAEEGFSSSSHHKSLLSSLLMTACDLSACTKDWETSVSVSNLIYKEFFTQGDLEKALGATPSLMMDRDKAFIPELQIQFVNSIAAPVYRILSKVLPQSSPLYESMCLNREKWEKLKEVGVK